MTQNYHVTMDGGKRFLDIRADSAATAMSTALERNRGYCVTACQAGGVHNPNHPSQYAEINFEVPKHDPLPIIDKVKIVKPACTLFDDAEITEESKRAKLRHGTT